MRLRHITFTGIDAHTDLQELHDIQMRYPIAEFGVLTSYHWFENGNRYLDPYLIDTQLGGRSLKLALHVCGRAACDAALGWWNMIEKMTWGNLNLFHRVQLNIANRTDSPAAITKCPKKSGLEIIIQQRDAQHLQVYEATFEKFRHRTCSDYCPFSVLLDASGGQGIDTPITIAPPFTAPKIGYAGGINPDNVADKLTYLFENVHTGEFWIDMESGVRTNDWFDLGKVRQVLEICQPIIDKHKQD